MTEADKAIAVIANWWSACGFTPPFTPGQMSGTNDGCVRDATGAIVANCGGNEARADVIAAALNFATMAMNSSRPLRI